MSLGCNPMSPGAAIAMLAAYELEYEERIPVAGVWTFGQPRVGNRAFRAFYNAGSPDRTWRLTHWRDPAAQHAEKASGGYTYYDKWACVWLRDRRLQRKLGASPHAGAASRLPAGPWAARQTCAPLSAACSQEPGEPTPRLALVRASSV